MPKAPDPSAFIFLNSGSFRMRSSAWFGASPLGVNGSTNCEITIRWDTPHVFVNNLPQKKQRFCCARMSSYPSARAVESFPDPTSLSWRSLRMVLFLLMWRRRSNTKTDRPAMRAASSPPTTPAAIMEKPDVLKDGRKQIYISKTEIRLTKDDMGGLKTTLSFSAWLILLRLHTLCFDNLQDQDQCTWKTQRR